MSLGVGLVHHPFTATVTLSVGASGQSFSASLTRLVTASDDDQCMSIRL